jgi:hypothetical protein
MWLVGGWLVHTNMLACACTRRIVLRVTSVVVVTPTSVVVEVKPSATHCSVGVRLSVCCDTLIVERGVLGDVKGVG